MNCPICTKSVRQLFLNALGQQRCRACNALSDEECYALLVGRIDASINQWRVMSHEAFKRGDSTAVWECGAQIKNLERQKASLRKPNQPQPK